MSDLPGGRRPHMRRREFVAGLTGAAVWPRGTRAQQSMRMRRIGVLMDLSVSDPVGQARVAAFLHALEQLGWSVGRNVRMDTRWSAGSVADARKYAAELLALEPEVILASGGAVAGPLRQATSTVPIVFTQTADPVGAGFVESLSRPGGNATGFALFEFGISSKWLELLKEIAPRVTRVAVLRDTTTTAGIGQFAALQAVAPSFQVELRPIDVGDAREIERGITSFAPSANAGLIVTGSPLAIVHRELIITLAARHHLPAIYTARYYATGGGLISYGPDSIDPHRRAAAYVDRILKGEKPSDMPVLAPTKYELVINLKTAKTLDLAVPQSLLARADEVIE